MSSTPLVLIQPNTVDAKTVRSLRKAGYLVIEIADITALRIVAAPQLLPLNTLAMIALETVLDEKVFNSNIREEFRNRVTKVALSSAKGSEDQKQERQATLRRCLDVPKVNTSLDVPGGETVSVSGSTGDAQ